MMPTKDYSEAAMNSDLSRVSRIGDFKGTHAPENDSKGLVNQPSILKKGKLSISGSNGGTMKKRKSPSTSDSIDASKSGDNAYTPSKKLKATLERSSPILPAPLATRDRPDSVEVADLDSTTDDPAVVLGNTINHGSEGGVVVQSGDEKTDSEEEMFLQHKKDSLWGVATSSAKSSQNRPVTSKVSTKVWTFYKILITLYRRSIARN